MPRVRIRLEGEPVTDEVEVLNQELSIQEASRAKGGRPRKPEPSAREWDMVDKILVKKGRAQVQRGSIRLAAEVLSAKRGAFQEPDPMEARKLVVSEGQLRRWIRNQCQSLQEWLDQRGVPNWLETE